MFRTATYTACVIGLGVPMLASAAWTGKGELGAAKSDLATGASSTTFTAKFDLADELDSWKHAFGASTVYTDATAEATADDPAPDKEVTAKRWEVHEQSDYKINERAFWFGAARYEDTEFGTYDYQSVLSTGAGYKFLDSNATKLSAQLGYGYRRYKEFDAPGRSEAVGTGSIELTQQLTMNTSLQDKVTVESGSSNTLVQNDLSLKVQMANSLALAIAHQLRYNSQPGDNYLGLEYAHSDRLLTVNLVYEFK